MPYFVFVEFGCESIREYLASLRVALTQSQKSSPVHVTLRGPYTVPPPLDELQDYADRMQGYGVKIHGYGFFNTPNGYAVFLRAECTVFREIWDKPDFKVLKTMSIQPHITVFESPSRTTANIVKNFLKRESIHIHTYDVHLSVYNSRENQLELFGIPPIFPKRMTSKKDIWRKPKDFLDRAFLERASLLGKEIQTVDDG